ncbi:MAG: protein kinase [Bacteroidales bacterium]|nr:protein kinase [Bacteroidales bacterium]
MAINTTLQGGKYKIVKVLGQGGFGITYLAYRNYLDDYVAIKEFFFSKYCDRDETTSHVTVGTKGNRELVDLFKVKFLKEAKKTSKLRHPNIVEILDCFEENATVYYVMEYIEGGNLGDMVKLRGTIPENEAIGYIRQVGKALNFIHEKFINHLDVKPSNVINDNGRMVLIDFGVSKQYDATTKKGTTDTPVGVSHGYSPAEQYTQKGVQTFSPESDVYALAATLYKLLTGVTPPESVEIADGLPVDELVKCKVSEKTIAAMCNAMKTRKDRTQSVSAFLEQLPQSSDTDQDEPLEVDEETALVGVISENVSTEGTLGSSHAKDPVPPSKGKGRKIAVGVAAALVAVALVVFVTMSFIGGKEDAEPEFTLVKDYEVMDNSGSYHWWGRLENDLPNGHGTAVYSEDDPSGRKQFKGGMKNGIKDCKSGMLTYRNGDYYEGSFKNDDFDEGTYYVVGSGEKFVGTFNNNQPAKGSWYNVSSGKVLQTL